jgi:hypothetical protein
MTELQRGLKRWNIQLSYWAAPSAVQNEAATGVFMSSVCRLVPSR